MHWFVKFVSIGVHHLVLGVVVFLSCGGRLAAQTQWPEHLPQWKAGRVVVKVKPEHRGFCQSTQLSLPGIERVLSALGGVRVSRKFPFAQRPEGLSPTGEPLVDLTLTYNLDYSAPLEVPQAIALLLKTGWFEYAEPHVYHMPMTGVLPNDADTLQQWFITVMRLNTGWAISQGDTTVKIGIIDTGVEWTHPDLVTQVQYNYNDPIDGLDNDGDGLVDNFRGWDLVGSSDQTFQPDNDPNPNSNLTFIDHGTKVAGFAAAATDNNLGVVGSGFKCRFVPYKVSADNDSRGTALILAGYEAIVLAADQGCQVINCSWGGPLRTQTGQDVVNYATLNRNAMVVAAGGNTFTDQAIYPAAFANVLSVASLSNQGQGLTTYNYSIDVGAPGTSRTTTRGAGYTYEGPFSSYSSPLVAGVAAIVRSYYPNLSAQQAAERVRVTCSDIYNNPANQPFIHKFGKGMVNLQQALAATTPAIRLQSFTVTDGNDNVFIEGDTLRLVGTWRNFLNPTSNLVLTLTSLDPANLQVLQGGAGLGVMSTLTTRSNVNTPFRLRIPPGAETNKVVTLRITYNDNPYVDVEHIQLLINPTYVTVNTGTVQLSLNSLGNVGFNNYPQNTQGAGFLRNNNSLLYEGGLMVGQRGRVMDNIRNTFNQPDSDFVSLQRASLRIPGNQANVEGFARFSDAGGGPQRLNITTDVEVLGYTDAANDDYLILKYTIRNNSTFIALDSLFAGLFLDWDAGANPTLDSATAILARRLAYTHGSRGSGRSFVGAQLLSSEALNLFSGNNNAFVFSNVEKFKALRSSTDSLQQGRVDAFQVVSGGPFILTPGASRTVYFSLVSGNSLNELLTAAQAAEARYACLFSPTPLRVRLGNDTTVCEQFTLSAANPQAVSYAWNTGQNSSTLNVTTSGTYSVLITDAGGCTASDEININVQQPGALVVSLPNSFTAGVPFTYADNTPGSTNWIWDFGNGFGSTVRTGTMFYEEAGNYTIRLVARTGACQDTFRQSITVQANTARPSRLPAQVRLYPNPASEMLYLDDPNGTVQTITWVDATGREVRREAAQPSMPISELPKGLYLMKLSCASAEYWVSILLQ